jgi:hypothetical protein
VVVVLLGDFSLFSLLLCFRAYERLFAPTFGVVVVVLSSLSSSPLPVVVAIVDRAIRISLATLSSFVRFNRSKSSIFFSRFFCTSFRVSFTRFSIIALLLLLSSSLFFVFVLLFSRTFMLYLYRVVCQQ